MLKKVTEGPPTDEAQSPELPLEEEEEEVIYSDRKGPVQGNSEARQTAYNILAFAEEAERLQYADKEPPAEPYYWDIEDGPENTRKRVKAWHYTCWGAEKTLEGAEFMGEIFANFLGLTQSKYQWILDAKEQDEERERHKALCDRQRRELRLKKLIEQEKKRQSELDSAEGKEAV